jgi:hypothetical protein
VGHGYAREVVVVSAAEQEEPREREQLVTVHEWGEPWQGPFLEALARMPNVAAACRVAGVGRSTVYRHANDEPVFRNAWREAVDIGIDLMERIAHQRATTGWESEETRRTVKRALNERGELVTIEEQTVTVTRNEVSDQLMVRLLAAYRPRRFREQVEHHLGPADELESTQPVGPEDDGIHRRPTPERARELARIALELEAGPPVVDGNGKPGDAE